MPRLAHPPGDDAQASGTFHADATDRGATDPDDPQDLPPVRPVTRRSFVKGCVAASALGAAGIGSQALLGSAAPPLGPVRRVDYLGCTVLRGPAPQGLPLLPLAWDGEGRLHAEPHPPGLDDEEEAGEAVEARGVLDWYRYCGHAEAPGLRPDFAARDELLRFHLPADKRPQVEELDATGLAPGGAAWYLDRLGEAASAKDFVAGPVGMGAPMQWRAEGQPAIHRVPALVLKVDPASLQVPAPWRDVVQGFLAPLPDGHALVGYVAWCKHFCCIPGWQESPRAHQEGFGDTLFCTCHGSAFDPLRIKPDFYLLQEA